MNDFQLEEYRRLTTEMGNNSARVFQLIAIVIPLTTAMLGLPLAFEEINGLWILLPNLVLIPSLFLVSSQFKSVTRIATYIRSFYENDKKKSIGWEERLHALRKKNKNISSYYRSIQAIFWSLSTISFIISFLYLLKEDSFVSNYINFFLQFYAYLFALVITVLAYVSANVSIKKSRDEVKFMKDWELVKETVTNNM